jgi:polar amino acid transport system permease protein
MQSEGCHVGVDNALIPARAAPPVSRLAWNRLDLLWLVVVAALLAAGMLNSQGAFSYRWDWGSVWPYFVKTDSVTGQWAPNLLLQGLMCTLRLALWGMLMATWVGLIAGWMRNHPRLLLRMVASAYVMTVRNIPPVVFVFIFVYFISNQFMPFLALDQRVSALPVEVQSILTVFFGPMELINNFFLGLVCLSVFSGAYVTEIVRAGLNSVPSGQSEAAQSLGMSNSDVMIQVVWPQALRNVMPSLTGQFIQLIKDSSLVSLVSIQELSFMAQDVQVSTQRVFEVFVLTAAIYFCICFVLSQVFAYIERRHGRAH